MFFNEEEDYVTIDLKENINTQINTHRYINKIDVKKIFKFFNSKKDKICLLTIFIILYYVYIFYFIKYI